MIRLPVEPRVSWEWRSRLIRLLDLTRNDPPTDLAAAVREELGVDLSARYAGVRLPHPFGKASGQLSLNLSQVRADVAAGVAFVVLKTVIAEDVEEGRSMGEWAVDESRMTVERKTSRSGRIGWTVTWQGRGWAGSLDDYLQFFAQAQVLAKDRNVPVIPSVKYHLPVGGESFRTSEYEHTTRSLLRAWQQPHCSAEMILEKDLSPTLAGDGRSGNRDRVLAWLATIPRLIQDAALGRVRLGVKLMNALFDDQFQVEMMRVLSECADSKPAFLVTFNRLFDPERGVAYGGWDLSDRNLRVLDLARQQLEALPGLSATGNICSGRVMLEYALRGCENGQLHTFFQLPFSEYTATAGSRSARALHTLILHPTRGLAVWLRHLCECGALEERDGAVRFIDLTEQCRRAA
jgi:hypothetical protein